ncbi:MurR/RpiR family transcriptional regulator [Nonomuraea sp. NPDC001699]
MSRTSTSLKIAVPCGCPTQRTGRVGHAWDQAPASGAHRVPGSASARARTLLDLGGSAAVVAYDFRRYSPATARFTEAACARGARLALITDAWESPLAARAEVLIRLPREAAGPIAPLAHQIAVTELLLVAVAARLEPAGRLADLDALTEML